MVSSLVVTLIKSLNKNPGLIKELAVRLLPGGLCERGCFFLWRGLKDLKRAPFEGSLGFP